jgi:hypothetical protein
MFLKNFNSPGENKKHAATKDLSIGWSKREIQNKEMIVPYEKEKRQLVSNQLIGVLTSRPNT